MAMEVEIAPNCQDFNLVRKNYPEILRAMQTQLVKSLRWVQ
jgi:hypothetical protein